MLAGEGLNALLTHNTNNDDNIMDYALFPQEIHSNR